LVTPFADFEGGRWCFQYQHHYRPKGIGDMSKDCVAC